MVGQMDSKTLRLLNELSKIAPSEKKQAFLDACFVNGFIPPREIVENRALELYLEVTEWTPNLILLCQELTK